MKPAKTQQDHNMDFDGMAGTGVNRGANRFAGNQWSGHSNDGRLVNKGRGPTRGNDGSCHDPISGAKTQKGAPSHVHDTHAPGAYGKAPYRGVGGTAMPKTGKTEFNAGRGPTKGNQR